jgi:hypothetical protein
MADIPEVPSAIVRTASEAKRAANRRNAKCSTGPRDTSHTRLNALKDGIWSSEQVIVSELERGELKLYRSLKRGLLQDLRPVGAVEKLLVEDLINLAWRRRRLLRAETIAINEELRNQEDRRIIHDLREHIRQAWAEIARVERDRFAIASIELCSSSPLDKHQELVERVWSVLNSVEYRDITKEIVRMRGIKITGKRPSVSDIKELIEWVCASRKKSIEQFWHSVEMSASQDLTRWEQTLERQQRLEQHAPWSAGVLPEDKGEKLQRGESFLSRRWERTLHELQRLQDRRAGNPSLPPAVLDVTISSPESDR